MEQIFSVHDESWELTLDKDLTQEEEKALPNVKEFLKPYTNFRKLPNGRELDETVMTINQLIAVAKQIQFAFHAKIEMKVFHSYEDSCLQIEVTKDGAEIARLVAYPLMNLDVVATAFNKEF